ncbi:hypothetical protein FRACYDRAFT_250641 [Fragilariopsis cylindrus CCMP1102]|uniref:Uncharacterized protein n=1 Tax=Fragilariopsis cylindrus CCMP1102 TaxID=635003 RepID=A0A1E7EPS4_9STRA|nr:hypothetical protein FRACYDRAFT_250641 [Fragilariopsis cylindrus CCMP1102]|eukprot:OEU07959.1 hypothetical protein FRACYDRAFT_250641 [Fragilariopsis cylindrus CCMP1102]
MDNLSSENVAFELHKNYCTYSPKCNFQLDLHMLLTLFTLVLLICFLVVVVSTTKIEARVIVGSTEKEDRLDFMYNEDENKDCFHWVMALSTSSSKSNSNSNSNSNLMNSMTTEKQKRCNMEWKGKLISDYWCPKTCQQQQQNQQEQQSQSEVQQQVNDKQLPSYDEVMNHNNINDTNAALVNVVVPSHGRYVVQSSGKSVTSFCARHNKFNKRDCQQHHAATNTASHLRGGRNGRQKDHKQNDDDNNDQQKGKSMVIA